VSKTKQNITLKTNSKYQHKNKHLDNTLKKITNSCFTGKKSYTCRKKLHNIKLFQKLLDDYVA
jgi:hypothetical protein